MENARESMIIQASPQECYDVATSFSEYPLWAQDVKEVIVNSYGELNRASQVTFRAGAFGRTTFYTLSYDYSKAPTVLSWVQVGGDITSKLDGSYSFNLLKDGSTEVVYELSVELAVPIPGFVKRRAEVRIVHAALRDLKDRVESVSRPKSTVLR